MILGRSNGHSRSGDRNRLAQVGLIVPRAMDRAAANRVDFKSRTAWAGWMERRRSPGVFSRLTDPRPGRSACQTAVARTRRIVDDGVASGPPRTTNPSVSRPRGSWVNLAGRTNERAFGVSFGLRPRTPARRPASPSTVAGSTPVPNPDVRSNKNKAASDTWSDAAFNSGDRIRTCDLRVMSPTSYQTALPRNQL